MLAGDVTESQKLPSEALGAEQLERSTEVLPRQTFTMLLRLTLTQPWLEGREAELLDLFELCEDNDEVNLLADLIYRFDSMSQKRFDSEMKDLVSHMISDLSLNPDRDIIIAPEKSDYSDGSQSILWRAKPHLSRHEGWTTTNLISNLEVAVDHVKDGSTVVLLEEFVGTGKTAATAHRIFVESLNSRGISARVVYMILSCMRAGSEYLARKGIEHFAKNLLSRGISDYYEGTQRDKALALMARIESRLCDKAEDGGLKKVRLGFKKSEALYYLDGGNTPNNVFPVFWWKWLSGSRRRQPLLDRL